MKLSLAPLQALGRALMLPIAVLPVAGLMLRLGQPDLLDIPFIAAAGDAVFANLGLLFAIGVAVGFARDNNGAAGLAGVVCYLVAAKGAETLLTVPPEVTAAFTGPSADLAAAAFKAKAIGKFGVPLGILSGVIAGVFYNRFGNLKLPEFLAFFGGRRFVPIISGLAGLVLAFILGEGWGLLNHGMDGLSTTIVNSGEAGLFVYGALNRLLIVTGLHHILNNVAWFIIGEYQGATGDLNRFFAGDPTAGGFMAGHFPGIMFGLPAACLAMYHTARPDRRAAVGGMLLSMALTAFLTGVTEPVEFAFMFLAPVLYAFHALMTGLAFVIMSLLEVKLGFTFSAGLFDYVINFGKATRPLWLIPIGLAYAGVYYGVFRFAIVRFNLKTPGREDEAELAAQEAQPATSGGRGSDFVLALGGAANLTTIDACTTRLRLTVADRAKVNEPRLKGLGAKGTVWLDGNALQVVLGPIADQLAGEVRAAAAAGEPATARPAIDVARLLAALGGAGNVKAVGACSSRLRLDLADTDAARDAELKAAGARGVVRPRPGALQVILGPAAEQVAGELRTLAGAAAG
ncbi:MAG: N-acetyl-D-glucosamine transporter [Caulobacter sp.]|jgi:PTS system N-acetylglucosamine-specific IIC component|nr:N-acetyl-D-glucosamine transporter [Caulobacter sp.]